MIRLGAVLALFPLVACARPVEAPSPAVTAAAARHHVVVITIDGLRPDAITASHACSGKAPPAWPRTCRGRR
jgi:predicted AlkP superfamily pyrophosphatase or phosphodiesterase